MHKHILGSQPDIRPYTPVAPLLLISLHVPPFPPKREQALSKSTPTIAVTLLVTGVNRQLKLFSTQLHALLLGVGGRVGDARNTELLAGQAG